MEREKEMEQGTEQIQEEIGSHEVVEEIVDDNPGEFSDEELVALGEKEPEEPESQPEEEPEENLVPQSRFDEVYGKTKSLEEEVKTLREQLETKELPAEEQPTDVFEADRNITIQSGRYQGFTLGEVYSEDPLAANHLHNEIIKERNRAEESAARTAEEKKNRINQEVGEFTSHISTELFGDDKKDLSDSEYDQINSIYGQVLDFMDKTNRHNMTPKDAYTLMNYEKKLEEAKAAGAKEMVGKLNDGVPSIAGGADSGTDTGYEAYLSMSGEKLADELDKMDDATLSKFFKEAPKELRDKHPAVPWG